MAQASTEAQAEAIDDLWEVAAGVGAAIGLYRHCARVMSVHILYYIWTGLGIGDPRTTVPTPQSRRRKAFGRSSQLSRLHRPLTSALL
jgi:hypothetical protein